MQPDSETCALLVDLSLRRHEWVRRKTETFGFDNASVLRQDTTYEVQVPSEALEFLKGRLAFYIPLPLVEIRRTPARHIQISATSDTASSLPQLTRAEERRIIAIGNAWNISHASSTAIPDDDQSEAIQPLLERYFQSQSDFFPPDRSCLTDEELVKLLRFDERTETLTSVVRRIRMTRTLFALLPMTSVSDKQIVSFVVSQSNPLSIFRVTAYRAIRAWTRRRQHIQPTDPSHALGHTADLDDSISHPGLYRLWHDSAEQTLSIVDSSGQPPKREASPPRSNQQMDDDYRSIMRNRWWVPDTFLVNISIPSYLDTGSYHAQFKAPPGVFVDRAILRYLNAEPLDMVGNPCSAEAFPFRSEMIIARDDEYHFDRFHLYLSRNMSEISGSEAARFLGAKLTIQLRPTFHNGLRSGMYISLLTTATLWFLWARFDSLLTIMSAGQPRQAVDRASLAAILLLVLSIALGVMVRQEEDHVTKLIQSRLRLRLFIVAMAAFYVSLTLAVGLAGGALRWSLVVSAVIATISTIPTLLSSLVSKYRIWHRHSQRRLWNEFRSFAGIG